VNIKTILSKLKAVPRRRRVAFFFIGGVIIIGVCFLLIPPARKTPVHLTVAVSRGDIEDAILASGTLQPITRVEVGAQVSGQLRHLKVKLGERVKKGQLLAEIDPALAQGDLLMARADLDGLQADRRGKQVRITLAEEEFARMEAMRDAEATSLRDWQRARAELETRRAELSELDARIAKARYLIEQRQINLAYTRIAAPVDGEVLSIDTKEGQTVISAQQAPKILTLGDLSRMEVWAQVSEADIVRVRPGQRAYFSLLGSPEKRYFGSVREIRPTPEKINNAMFYPVLFDVANTDRSLRTDMTAQVGVIQSEVGNSLVVPLTALGDRDVDGRYPIRVLQDGKDPVERKVHIGIKSRTHAQVLDGLEEGERVVTSTEGDENSGMMVSIG
jgi:macrolide-specific efflux system membrane fusion protein